MKKHQVKKKKPKLKKKHSHGQQLVVASSIKWAGAIFIITQVDTEEDDHRESIFIKAVRLKPIHF